MKTEKYADLRASLKRLYPGYNVVQVNLVFDFLAGYHKELIHKLNNVGLSDSMNVIRKCQKYNVVVIIYSHITHTHTHAQKLEINLRDLVSFHIRSQLMQMHRCYSRCVGVSLNGTAALDEVESSVTT